jgi:hypothetical protein
LHGDVALRNIVRSRQRHDHAMFVLCRPRSHPKLSPFTRTSSLTRSVFIGPDPNRAK